MKIKSLLAGMFACAALVACTNNDLVEEGGNQPLEGDAYVAVAISNPAASFGRAASAGGEEYGTDAENKVDGATFVFFDATGNYITSVATTLTFNKNKQQSEAVLVLKNASVTPASVVAFLNVPSGLNLNQSLSSLLASAGNYGYGANSTFVMSNSVFKDGKSAMQIATPVGDHIKNKEADAMDYPLPIYVERVLAKVTIKKDTQFKAETTEVTLDGNQVTLKPEIQGWTVSGMNNTSYILKNLTKTIDERWVWGNNRSFWAEDVNYTGFVTNQTADLTFSSYLETQNTPLYCLENTLTWDAYQAATVAYTHLLVTARIKIEGTTEFLKSFCNYNGVYWTEDNLKTEFVNGLGEFTKTDGSDITTADIKFVQAGTTGNKAYMAKAVFVDENQVTREAVTALENKGQFMLYKDGKCYFWTPIEHFGTQGATGSIGVVRNHVYALNLKTIAGLGTPIVDPDQPIVPEKPTDDNSYLAAQVNILAWKMVSQDVDLK